MEGAVRSHGRVQRAVLGAFFSQPFLISTSTINLKQRFFFTVHHATTFGRVFKLSATARQLFLVNNGRPEAQGPTRLFMWHWTRVCWMVEKEGKEGIPPSKLPKERVDDAVGRIYRYFLTQGVLHVHW